MANRILHSIIFCLLAAHAAHSAASQPPLAFGVISQRTPTVTAQYWNPILAYVSKRTGIQLELKLAKTGPDHAAAINRGEYHFIYSNHNFTPDAEAARYSVIARPAGDSIRGQLIVLANSEISSPEGLAGKDVVFPSQVAFVGYYVPMDMMSKRGIKVNPLFAGNQEGAVGQMASGRAAAAAVNSQVAKEYAERAGIEYRALWSSEEYLPIPVSAHVSVDKRHVAVIRKALLDMHMDPEGLAVLRNSAAVVKQAPPFGFVAAHDSEYDNVRKVYKSRLTAERMQ